MEHLGVRSRSVDGRRQRKLALTIIGGFALALIIAGCGGGGLSEKELYYEVAAAEDTADLEARKQANGCTRGGLDLDVEKYASLARPLMEHYRNEVLAEYGVSQEEWRKIALKGAKQHWDTPEVPTC